MGCMDPLGMDPLGMRKDYMLAKIANESTGLACFLK